MYSYMRGKTDGYDFIEFEISNITTSTVFRQHLKLFRVPHLAVS